MPGRLDREKRSSHERKRELQRKIFYCLIVVIYPYTNETTAMCESAKKTMEEESKKSEERERE